MLFVCAVIAVLLGTAHSQCTRLPTDDQIENSLLSIIIGNEGDKLVLLISHHFTCIASGQKMGQLQQVSIAVVFNVTMDLLDVTETRRQQIQLECTTNNNYQRATTSLEQNPPAVAFTLTTRKDCFLCVPSAPTNINVDADANCAGKSCMHACLILYYSCHFVFLCACSVSQPVWRIGRSRSLL